MTISTKCLSATQFVEILRKHREQTRGHTINESNVIELFHREDMFVKMLLEVTE